MIARYDVIRIADMIALRHARNARPPVRYRLQCGFPVVPIALLSPTHTRTSLRK